MSRRSSVQGELPTQYAQLFDDLDDLERRLAILEAPSGEALASTVAKLQELVTNIQAQLDAWVASRWTNAQVQSAINSTIASTLAGNVTIGGQFRAPDAVAFNITGTRRTAWLEDSTGRLGYAPSTRRLKGMIREVEPERMLRLLDIVPKTFLYRPQVLRRIHLRATYGVDWMPPREIGLIAEELDEAGFSEFVIYDAEGLPEGVEYSMLTVALLGVARAQRDEIADLRNDVAEIRATLANG